MSPEFTSEANDWESIVLYEGTPADNYTFLEVSQEVIPGDVFFIQGPVLRRPLESSDSPTDDPPEGDTVDGEQTSFEHLFSAVVKRPSKLQINHTCYITGEDVVLTVFHANTSEVLGSAVTSCQWVIENMTFAVSQVETEEFNAFINLDPPYFVRSDVAFNLSVQVDKSGPMGLNFTIPPISHVTSYFIPDDLPAGPESHILNLTAHVGVPGVYVAFLEGENKHNLDSDPVVTYVDLVVQHPVVQTWEVWPDDEIWAFKIPSEEASFRFNDTAGLPFPTNATAFINWGDLTGQDVVPFEDPGEGMPLFNHTYTEDGVYTVEVFIFNDVSGCNITCNVTIVEEIQDLHMYKINE
ncbi:uncharacterized protein [Penaeus vannamei]|uniref:uncharacterized protein n=1 Tax=Penaeus vannamei TaxID=6689 RepID=UPI00387F91B9